MIEGVRYGAVLFDLDGTLTDPGVGIFNSVSFALSRLGAEPLDRAQLRDFVGPPAHDCFEALGFDAATSERAVVEYRRYMAEKGLYENEVYPGIEAVLSGLRDGGATLAVATSKPTVFARRVLEHFGLSGYFAYVSGSELDGRARAKHEVISIAITALGLVGRDDVCMVGDRALDVTGAAALSLPAVAVAWGYAADGELESAGAAAVAHTPAELLALLS
ncbi:MAG: HAD hydrolase-like protein [Acidimicrobiales bacterium]|jgi:phosphoglycolate phosphatase